ncbi:MAG: asparagine--tRNA ligase [Thiotrichales bacterium]|nr:MAG: asparagine--tRNA ligase [Thiotrichales bacterium]
MIKDLYKTPSENLPVTVCIQGWVRTRRDSKAGISFLAINDGSCLSGIQVVAPDSLANYSSEIIELTKDCAVTITGELVESRGKGQTVEIKASEIVVHGVVEEPLTYPVSPKRHTMEHLREYAHLRARTNIFGAITRVRHTVANIIHNFFHNEGFFWINTPIITSNDCEGAGELFSISTLDRTNNQQAEAKDFFSKESFLTVSGQLCLESYCLAMSKVYTFGPTFRAENSNTSRHLAEFWMIEPEIAFADLQMDVQLADKLLRHVTKTVLQECQEDMQFFNQWVDKDCIQRLEHFLANKLEVIEYKDAIKHLEKAKQKFEFPVAYGKDLQSEHERYLVEKLFDAPIAIINYPKNIKAFYMRVNDDDQTVAAMDIIVPGIGEIIGGAQREERMDVLDARMQECNVNAKDLAWYKDLRRYGTVPHAGFGLGFERLLGYLTGVANVRDLIPFPRTPGNINY